MASHTHHVPGAGAVVGVRGSSDRGAAPCSVQLALLHRNICNQGTKGGQVSTVNKQTNKQDNQEPHTELDEQTTEQDIPVHHQ